MEPTRTGYVMIVPLSATEPVGGTGRRLPDGPVCAIHRVLR